MQYIIQVIQDIWLMMTTAAPFILFGFLAAGLIHTFVKAERIVALLGKRNWKSVFIASLCGLPLPLCSCSVLPTAATLREKGASRGATTSFLISTPETGVDSILLTYGMMGGWMALLRPVAAAITALSAGLAVNFFGWEESALQQEKPKASCCHAAPQPIQPVQKSCCGGSAPKPKAKSWWQTTLHYGFVELSNNLAKWLALGFILSGIISAMLPTSLFESWAGQGFSSLILMLLISMPMYICASGSTPIAAAMLMKGLSPGAAVVFLLAGPATNMAALPVLYKILGKRSTVIYLVSIFVITLAIGMMINLFFTPEHFTINMGHLHDENSYYLWNTICGEILSGLILKGLFRNFTLYKKSHQTTAA